MLGLRYIKALADETRIRLVLILNHYELSVNELVTLLGMGQSRVSRHLKILAEAGLLKARRDGLWVFYSTLETGPARDFLRGILPHFAGEELVRADLDMAVTIIEERARHTRNFFNSIAEDWDALNREVLGDFDLPEAIKNIVPSGCGIAVDLGCGTGEVVADLREVCDVVIGVDGSPRMLELARRRFKAGLANISLRIGELDHLPLRDNEADFACINLVLHHLSKPENALRESSRVLRPGGTLLVTDFDSHQQENMRTAYGDRWLGFSCEDLTKMLSEAGLTPVEHTRHAVNLGLSLHMVRAVKD